MQWKCGQDMSAAANEFIVVVQRGLAHLLDLHVVLDHDPVGDHPGDVLLEQGLTLPSLETTTIF